MLFGPPQDTPTTGPSPVVSRPVGPQVGPIDDEGIDPTNNQVASRPEISADVPVAGPTGTTVVARSADGERTIAAADFFTGFLETALREDELLTEIRVPKAGSGGFDYQKFNRRAQDWAIVGAVAATVAGERRVALVNMGSTPIRCTSVEAALAGGASIADAAALAADGTEAPQDLNASVEYREHLARVLVRRALEAASA